MDDIKKSLTHDRKKMYYLS